MATFINRTKNSISPTNKDKYVRGGYGYARYGMSFYGDGGFITNLVKSLLSGTTWNSMTTSWNSSTSSWNSYGVSGWINKVKN